MIDDGNRLVIFHTAIRMNTRGTNTEMMQSIVKWKWCFVRLVIFHPATRMEPNTRQSMVKSIAIEQIIPSLLTWWTSYIIISNGMIAKSTWLQEKMLLDFSNWGGVDIWLSISGSLILDLVFYCKLLFFLPALASQKRLHKGTKGAVAWAKVGLISKSLLKYLDNDDTIVVLALWPER